MPELDSAGIAQSLEAFDANSFCILSSVIDISKANALAEALEGAESKSKAKLPPGIKRIDPNDSNIRVFDLIENGATRYLPGSHRFRRFKDVPENAIRDTKAFSAAAGSAVIMDGRLWHTSGANRSKDRRRACLFAFYNRAFLRLQNNWWQALSPATIGRLSTQQRRRLGLLSGNIEYGTYLTE